MNKLSKFQQMLVDEGYCDARGAGFCATATRLPHGEYGIVALCVNGNMLNIFDVQGVVQAQMGRQLYSVKLSEVAGLKMHSNILSQQLRFLYEGEEYRFTNFLRVKPALMVIEEESKKSL